jgi:dihydrofolate reductase
MNLCNRTISIIAAISKNYIISISNTIPWYLPEDLAWFRLHTLGKIIIMGRITFESIGFLLDKRTSIVVSNKPGHFKGVIWATSINEAVSMTSMGSEIMVIGGGSIYKQMMGQANKLYLTHVNTRIDVSGGTRFPRYYPKNWRSVFRKNCRNEYHGSPTYSFEIFERYC